MREGTFKTILEDFLWGLKIVVGKEDKMVLALLFPLSSSLLSTSLIPSELKIRTCWGKLGISAVLPGCLLSGMASLFLGLYLVLFFSLDSSISRKEEG